MSKLAEFLTPAARMAVLRQASQALQAQYPRREIFTRSLVGPHLVEVYAAFKWPGFVDVTCKLTGELLARSVPGRPFELDLEALTAA